ncbi:MAG: DUF1499 domain-containing protein [Gammaproteobacteria bacterium]|nr:DUF1499 domain-containing protein [Gammaproteobacteria bacterium]
MNQSKTSTRLLLVSAVIILIILAGGPLGYKYFMVPMMPSLMSLVLAFAGGLLLLVSAVVMLFIALRQRLLKDRNLLLITMVLSSVPVIVMLPQFIALLSVPPIHDITTDTVNPPVFDAIVPLRAGAPNSLVYGSGLLAADILANKENIDYPQAFKAEIHIMPDTSDILENESNPMHAAVLSYMQSAAYPHIRSLDTSLGIAQAVSRAETVLGEQGLDIVAVNAEKGLVEATETSFWFGFKNDVVVRVTALDNGSRIDVRSVSRMGISDIGKNAARIEQFLQAF